MTAAEWIALAIAFSSAVTCVSSTYFSRKTLKLISRQLDLMTEANKKSDFHLSQIAQGNLAQAYIEHNWRLYENWGRDFPRMLSAWSGLSRRGLGWRMVILNHLNLAKTVFDDHNGGRMDDAEWSLWLDQPRSWFAGLRGEERMRRRDRREGIETLRQLVKENCYPEGFLTCLAEAGVLPDLSTTNGKRKPIRRLEVGFRRVA
jgi:hypothetical protein